MHLPFLGFERNRKRDFYRLLNTTLFVKIFKIHKIYFFEPRRCISTKLLWLIQLFNDIWTCQLDIHVLIIIWTSRSESVYKILHAVLLRLYAVNHNSQLVTSTIFCFLQFGIKYLRVWDFEIIFSQQNRIIAWLFWW